MGTLTEKGGMMNVLGSVVVAVAVVAAVVVLGVHGTITGDAAYGLLAAIVAGGFALAGHTVGTLQARRRDE